MKNGLLGMLLFLIIIVLIVCAFSTICAYACPDGAAEARLAIIMYHDVVNDAPASEYTVTADMLEMDIASLRHNGWSIVSLADVLDYAQGNADLPPKSVMLTFDDAYVSFRNNALPILQDENAPAILSVIGRNASGCGEGKYLSWAELHAIADSDLVELQSHSACLHVYRARHGVTRFVGESISKYRAMLTCDAELMNAMANNADVALLPSFAYPYGITSKLADDILKDAGYLCTMSSNKFVNVLNFGEPDCLFGLGRINRSGDMTTEDLIEFLENG